MLAIGKLVGKLDRRESRKMSYEEQRSKQEITQVEQEPPPKPLAKKRRYAPAYWITFVSLLLAIYAVERLFFSGLFAIAIGPFVAGLLAAPIAARLFPPVEK